MRHTKSRFEMLEDRRVFAAFTPGDIAVVRIGTGDGSLTSVSTAVFIDEYNPSTGALVQSIALPTADGGSGTANHALTSSGSAASEDALNLSSDGQYLSLVGYDAAPGVASISGTLSTTTGRTVGLIDYNGNVNTTTVLNNFASGNNPRAAVTTDGTDIWVAGADASSGVQYVSVGGTTGTALTSSNNQKNMRDVEIANGQLYFATDKSPATQIVSALGTGTPTSGTPSQPTQAGLPGSALAFGSNSATNSFFFARLGSGATDNGYDTLYVADGSGASTNATPGITKYSYNGSAWVSDGSFGTANSYVGLTGSVSGTTVTLYATQGAGAGVRATEIDLITDTSGFAGSFTAPTERQIAAAGNNTVFGGVALVPTAPSVHFSVTTSPTTVTAGSDFSVTVEALNSANQIVPGYRGTVSFSTTDPNSGVVLPANYTFTATDDGTHTFANQAALDTAGSQSITATDTVGGGMGSAAVTVDAGALAQLGVSTPVDATALQPFSVTVAAEDAYGNAVTGFTGTVQLSTSDHGAGGAVPANYTFQPGDDGSHTFTAPSNGVTLATAGNQTVSAQVVGQSSIAGNATVDDFVVQPFTAGDLVVYRVGLGGGNGLNSAGAPVFLDEYTPGGTLVESVPMPVQSTSGGNQALVGSGNATSEGQLALSPNGEYLALTGYDTTPGGSANSVISSTSSTSVPRTVAIVGPSGSVNTTTALTNIDSGNNIRGAVTTDGTNIWVSSPTDGISYATAGSSTATDIVAPADEQNLRSVEIAGGQLYASSQKTVRLAAIGIGTPTTPNQSLTELPGLPSNGATETPNGFFVAAVGSSSINTVYLTDSTGDDIEKYSLIDGNWDLEGTINVPDVIGLTGSINGANVTLFATTSGATGEAGTLYSYTDTTGFGGFVSGTATTIANAATNEAFRGVAMVPQAPTTTATHFAISAPSSATAGVPFTITVTAEDASNNVVKNFTGTVNFSSSDTNSAVVLPSSFTFTSSDAGTFTFTNQTTLGTAGTQTIGVGGSIFGSTSVTVNPGPAASLSVTGPTYAQAGVPFSITVAALDAEGNVATGYTGTVAFTKSDSGAGSAVPANYMFTPTNQGVATFSNGATLVSGYNQIITATDTHNSSIAGSDLEQVVQPFRAGDLVVYQVGDGSATLTSAATPVFLDEYSPSGTLVQSIPLPTTSTNGGNQALLSSGTATSEGEINLSPNGLYLTLTGYDSTVGTTSVASSTVPRTVAVINGSGGVNTTTALTNFDSANNIRGAVSPDGTQIWVTGNGSGVGYTTTGSSTATVVDPSGENNLRDVEIANDQLYVSSNQSTLSLATVGTGLPTTPSQTLTGLPGLPASGSTLDPNAFFFAHLNSSDTGPDTLYVTDTSSTGAIDKYSLVAGTWVQTGSIAVGDKNLTGLTGVVSGATVILYASGSGSAGTGGNLYTATDSTGYDGTASGTASMFAGAGVDVAFRGIALAPQPATSAATHFVISTPSSVTAGSPFNMTVTAENASNQVVTNFTGTVHFTTSDPSLSAVLPSDFTFVAADNGTFTFTGGVTLTTAGTQSITASGPVYGTTSLAVNAGPVSKLVVSAPPVATAGTSFSITVTAQDNFGNTVTNYTGTVHFTTSDTGTGAAVPANFTFNGTNDGTATFSGVKLVSAGNKTIAATDTVNSSVTGSGTVADYVVSPFTPGDVVVYRVGTGSIALSSAATVVFLDEYTPGGALVESIPMPVQSVASGNQALTASGTANSEGELNLSSNGNDLVLAGYDATPGTAGVASTLSTGTPRTIALVSGSGAVNTMTALTDFASGSNVRGATSTDGTNLWVVGNGSGVAYTTTGSTTSTALDPSGEQNLRDVEIAGGQLYVSSQKSLTLAAVGSGTPTTSPQTLTNLSGLPAVGSTINPNAFFLAHLNSSGSGPDTLYIVDTSSTGQIDKFSLLSGVWTETGTISVGDVNLMGLTGVVSGSNVTLYASGSGSLGTGGTLYSFTDSTGYNGTVSGTAVAFATAATNEAFRGMALVPATSATPPVLAAGGVAANYTAGGPASGAGSAAVDPGIAVADSTNISSATVSITGGFQSGDSLNFSTQGGITGSYNSSTGVLTLTDTAGTSAANFAAALESITFTSTSTSTATRTVSFSVTDANSLTSNTTTNTVNVFAPAKVTGVYIRGTGAGSGTNWSSLFTTYLDNHHDSSGVTFGSGTLGYLLRTGSTQLTPLPWSNVNTITVTFNEPVTINTSAAGFGLYGSATSGVSVPPLSSTSATSSVTSITFSFAGDITENKLLLEIPTTAVTDSRGAPLDGSFTNHTTGSTGQSFPSGTGLAGSGNFGFLFDVLPGDTTQAVIIAGNAATNERLDTNLTTASGSYTPYIDVLGAGIIAGADATLVRLHTDNTLTNLAAPTTGSGDATPLFDQTAGADDELAQIGFALVSGSQSSGSQSSAGASSAANTPATSSSSTSSSNPMAEPLTLASTDASTSQNARNSAVDNAVGDFDLADLWA